MFWLAQAFYLMKGFLSIILISASAALGQSGRVKPEETPTPNPKIKSTVGYTPTREKNISPLPTPVPAVANTDEEGVIKVDSNLVPIPVSVLDVNGRSLVNLKLADFELKIDGKIVEISELSRSETPIRMAMLFDNSGSVAIAREFEKDAAIKFFRRVIRPEKDLAALFSVATSTELEQPFTRDISSIVRAIEAFPPPTGATALLDGIVQASEYLAEVQGRRVIVIVSDGEDTYSDTTFENALEALQMSSSQVYVVKTTDFENFIRTKTRRGNANIRQLTAERRMIDITAQTGGTVYSPIDEKELDDAFRQIAAELSQQYILSYYPENEERGAFREISLKVKNQPTADIRTRKGYYVPKR